MADQAIQTSVPAIQSALICRLRHLVGRWWGPSPTAGEVELENISSDAVEIDYDMHPLQHLNLVVTNAAGTVLAAWHYGIIFSPFGRTRTLRLEPGEKYTHPVGLLGNVPKEKRVPGCYTTVAVYQHKSLRAVSEPLQVQLE